MNKEEYQDYLRSFHWQVFSGAVKLDTDSCEECGIGDTLNVHHKTYERLYAEKRADVVVLCERCHMNTHIISDRARMFRVVPEGASLVERRDSMMRKVENAKRS